ncbi:MAG TPA: sterol desaturase family protein [Saprospiraceae bacterium]|nr:sterol desaturase family protein [Saprospiraceae bacterium]
MDTIIDYFSDIPSLHRTIILVGGLTIFWLIESAIPLFKFNYRKWEHAKVNIFFTVTTIVVNFSMAFILVKTSDYVTFHKIGLLHVLDLPIWAFMIIGILLMDLIGSWFIHWLEHKVKWMWKFHLIHHTDQQIDTTSANRHHPGESVFRFVFTTLAVILIGAPMWIVFMYQTMSVVLTQFNHSNVQMPKWLDNTIGLLFCTPNIHRIHHHYRQPYTDTNYGNIFSIWDRIFGTYVMIDNSKLVYGVDTHMDAKEVTNITTILKMPFMPYREAISYDKEENLG